MRLVGLDIGEKRIGIAVSDELGLTAQGVSTLYRKNLSNDLNRLAEIIREQSAEKIIVGLPRNMNGTYGPQTQKVKDFIEALTLEFPLEVVYQDERMTTIVAERTLLEGNLSRKKRKTVVDKIAAVLILQAYLDRTAGCSEPDT